MHSIFNPIKPTLDNFDFKYFDYLFVENRLTAWLGEKTRDGDEIQSLSDFLQPNYIPTQIKAFFWGMDTMPDELNFSWINHLHYLGTENLHHEDGAPIPHYVRKGLSALTFSSQLVQNALGAANKASPSGIESLNKELTDLQDEETHGKVVFFLQQLSFDESKDIKGQVIDAAVAKKIYEEQEKLFEHNKEFLAKILSKYDINPASMFAASMTPNEAEKQRLLQGMQEVFFYECGILLSSVGYSLINKNPFNIRAKAEKMISNYNLSSKKTEEEKLNAIIILVKGLLNLHVWPDGNGRLCAHNLLNLLLIKNGLTPSLLKNNCLDAFSLEELRERIKEGMQSFNAKCDIKEKSLEEYRYKHNLPVTHESEFITAIINNKIDDVNTYIHASTTTMQLTRKDIAFFASCAEANINCFVDYFQENSILMIDDKAYTWEALINKFIKLSLDNANENLLCRTLEYCIANNISIDEDHIIDILINGNLKTYTLLAGKIIENQGNILIAFIYDLIPNCKDEKVASKLIDSFYNANNKGPALTSAFVSNMFTLQSSSIITKLIELPVFKEYLNFKSTGDLSKIITSRIDLTFDEQKLILHKIDPSFELVPFNPVKSRHSKLQSK